MKLVMKIHVECECSDPKTTGVSVADIEQIFHGVISKVTDDSYGNINIDPENTFVVATDYDEYHSNKE